MSVQATATLRAAFALLPSIVLLCSAAQAAGATVPAGAPGSPPPPLEAFGALPATTDVVLSPSGARLAWVDHSQAKPVVEMFDVQARKSLRILALPAHLELRALAWSDDQTLLITFSAIAESQDASKTSREYWVHMAYGASGGEGRMLPAVSGKARGAAAASQASLVRVSSKPHTVIMSSYSCYGGSGCLLAVDTATGEPTVIKTGNRQTQAWMVDRDGQAVAREDRDFRSRQYVVYALAGENVREILRKDYADPPILAGVLPDDSALVLLATNGRAHQAAWALPLDGSPMKLLVEEPDADISSVHFDGQTGGIDGVFVSGGKDQMHWLEPAAQQRQTVLERSFPGRGVAVRGWSADGQRTLVRVSSASSAPVYYLVDFNTHRADIVAEEYPALADVALGELRQISYPARDGTSIPAYLTLPPGKPKQPVPLVVLPHGGPQARDYPSFNWIVQFLATRGYAVLQPQFRGSAGFGDAFERAGYRQWGGLMQDDLSDGVKAMIDQGIADPHHVGIVGISSYSGYAAFAGAAFTPTLYTCAVSVNGISDLQALYQEQIPAASVAFNTPVQSLGSSFGGWGGPAITHWVSTAEPRWKERIGSPDDPALVARSPINAVAAIGIPVLIAYGDGAVPNSQSERMAAALQKAGKPVSVVKFPDGESWGSSTGARLQLLKALDSFLREHL